MADIFISYAKKDRKRVEPLAKTIEKQGWSVWWDPIIPTGKDFDDVIEEELSIARCIIVIWTKRSVKSKYVKGEAREALGRDILVPIEIESGIKPPFDFRSTQTLSLINWDGSDKLPEFQKLIDDVTGIIGKPPVKEQTEREVAKANRKAEEEQKPKEVRKEIKLDTEPKPPKPSKKSNAVKFGAVAGVIVLLIVGVWLYISIPTSLPKAQSAKERTAQVKKEVETRAGRVFRDKLKGGGTGPEMIILAAGDFLMGSPQTEKGRYEMEGPRHSVTISRPFALSTHEITFSEYDAFAKATGRQLPNDEIWGRGDRPVINVSWNDAKAYAAWLSEQTGQQYRLPTEAEWEYAGRAGSASMYSFGDDASQLHEYAWYLENSKNKTHLVGQKKPNAWGIYDMHGNVWEWVQDWYGDYSSNSVVDPKGPHNGVDRVIRGGGWFNGARVCRAASRYYVSPDSRDYYVGFRLARSVDLGS